MDVSLYTWQRDCLRAWFAAGTQGIVSVATGAGKTVMAAAAVEALQRKYPGRLRVRIVVPTLAIMKQWRDTLRKNRLADSRTLGYYCGSRRDAPESACMIYVINSARYALARHVLADLEQGFHVLLIADECHHYGSAENRRIFEFLPMLKEHGAHYHALGLSATPQPESPGSVLTKALGAEIYRYGFLEAVRGRTVSPFAILQIALSFTPQEREEYEELSASLARLLQKLRKYCPDLKKQSRAAFFNELKRLAEEGEEETARLAQSWLSLTWQRKELLCLAEARIFCVLCIVRALPCETKILIFSERIAQAEQMYALLKERYPGQVACYHSQAGEQARYNALRAFREGQARILVTCRALDEGMDVPEASVGIVLSGAAVKRQRIQRLGRILRTRPGKEVACLYYLYVDRSQEEPSYFFDGAKDYRIARLSYVQAEDVLVNPAYEETAARVLQAMETAGVEEERRQEARRCLQEGLARADWLLTEEQCAKRADRATDTRKRNYWICMRELARQSRDP